MSEPESTETAPAAKPHRKRKSFLIWLNLALLVFIVLAVNYISFREYYRRDLTEDQRYVISSQSINLLNSHLLQERKTPVKIIFAFQRTTQNYTRMRSLLEDYVHNSNGKIEVEFIDPLRQPNRAREIALIYDGLEFKKNQVVIDARQDTSRSLKSFEGKREGVSNVQHIPGDAFVVYEKSQDGKGMKAVALQMEDMMTAGLISALEGVRRPLYVISDKSNFNADKTDNEDSVYRTLEHICLSQNLEPKPLAINGLKKIPDDAMGLMIVAPQYDFTKEEVDVISDYWNRPKSAVLAFIDPNAKDNKYFYRFLREQGIRPQDDRILLRNRKQAYYQINAIFAPGLECTEDFWNSSTGLEGESISLQIADEDPQLGNRKIKTFPLLITTSEFYGETKYNKLNPQFDAQEDNPGPLLIAAAILRGNTSDINLSKETGRMAVFGNVDILRPKQIKPEQRDFIRSIVSWMTDREELAGMGSNHDLTIKLNLDRNALSFLQMLINLGLPLLALLIALVIWNTRRS